MTSPFRYRPPEQPDVDHDGKTVDDWEDNALSNSLAWSSVTFMPMWCQTDRSTGRPVRQHAVTPLVPAA